MASLNINFLFDTQTLIGALKKISYPTRFFRDNFFPMKTYSFNERVELDFRKVARAYAPKIRSRQSVPIMSRAGFDTEVVTPPIIGGARELDVDTIVQRWVGENPYATRTPAERAAEIIQTDLLEMDSFISRSEELDAVTMLTTGTAVDAFGNTQSFGTLNSFTPSVLWDAGSGTPTMLDDLWTMYQTVGENSLIWPNTVVMSPYIFEAFRGNAAIQNVFRAFNQYEGLMGTIKPDRLTDNVYYAGLITAPRLAVYVYTDFYLNTSGSNVQIWNSNNLLMGSTVGNNRFVYGAISQIEDVNTGEFVTYTELPRVPQVVADKDQNIRTLKLRSRYVPFAPDVTEWIVSAVTSAGGPI